MEILNYLQARKEIREGLSEEQIKLVLTVSGRAKEWISKCSDIVAQCHSDKEMVELSGMGRRILQQVKQEEWVYLVNPSLAPNESQVVRGEIICDSKLFSAALHEWLMAQELGLIYQLTINELTSEEAKLMRLLWDKQESVVERENVAEAIWGEQWSSKYSDWGIDALLHRIRSKLSGKWQIVTIKGRGYMLASFDKPTKAPQLALGKEDRVNEIPGSIYPSDEYLKYMNDPKRVRKVYGDLFEAMKRENVETNLQTNAKILCVNSYSYDNVDDVAKWAPKAKIYFVHYDPRAIDLHKERIKELGLEHRVEVLHDDMRESKLKADNFDVVINDFRFNFNQNDKQNKAMMGHMMRALKTGGVALISTVVDGRYENMRYGVDQEKAPINASRPGIFQADEHLMRRCWSVPYWRQLFEKIGMREIREFDIEEGKRWGGGVVTSTVNPWSGPYYRRWAGSK